MTTTTTTTTTNETEALKYTILLAVIIFIILLTCFESIRGIKNIFLKRINKKFQKNKRVPKAPPRYFLGWVRHILKVSEPDFLYMVGLDGYIFLRFIVVCLKISAFLAFWGVFVLLPIYATSNGQQNGWNKYTLANVVEPERLWVPAIFAYFFTGYVCILFYREYQGFVKKRLEYLVRGDMDTHQQTYYTLMVENLPPNLRSAPKLKAFFDTLFPDNVFAVNVCLDLGELESLADKRRQCRDSVENDVAFAHATGRGPIKWISTATFNRIKSNLDEVIPKYPIDATLGIIESSAVSQPYILNDLFKSITLKVNATLYHAYKLHLLNHKIQNLQVEFIEREAKLHEMEIDFMRSNPNLRANLILQYLFTDEENQNNNDQNNNNNNYNIVTNGSASNTPNDILERQSSFPELIREKSNETTYSEKEGDDFNEDWMLRMSNIRGRKYSVESNPDSVDDQPLVDESITSSGHGRRSIESPMKSLFSTVDQQTSAGQKIISTLLDDGKYVAMQSATDFAKEGARTARNVSQGAIKGVREATKAIELVTIGTFFRTSSTAFVTFTSRVSTGVGHQMLLSHENYKMSLKPAPCTTDIIWKNVSIPQVQIDSRKKITAAALVLGAIFWSFVVTGIHGIFNLQRLGNGRYSEYETNMIYIMFNSYLAVAILLILLTILPLIFDTISRYYECLKTESEIQNTIMVRYFYYQLANIYVTVTAGSIVDSLQNVLNHPESALRILGESLPKVSVYFASIIILMTFTSVMIEFIRVWPMICYYSATLFADKRRITRRSLRTGAFAAARMLYGWIYPSLLMVFMIISVYSCIAPITMCFAVIYYSFVYLMYKYQLLYVYVNEYQSGGYMWYAVFNMSMAALICGTLTLMGYILSKTEHKSGPFYFMLPIPILIGIFWRYCHKTFSSPSVNLSLEHAGIIDRFNREQKKKGIKVSLDTFKERTYRQPSLTEPQLFPEPYRLKTTFSSVHLKNPNPHSSSTTFNALLPPNVANNINISNHSNSNGISTNNSNKLSGNTPGIERRRSHNDSTFEMIRRGSFSADVILSPFNSMEIPDMKELLPHKSVDDVENSLNVNDSGINRRMTEDEIDDEQLDLCVNEILGGIADMEEITGS